MSGSSSGSSGSASVKSILKKGKGTDTFHDAKDTIPASGIQWDEMSILMTEHPADKDYGHMKIEEPKTPYHEMMPDEEGATSSSTPDQLFSPETLALKVQEASTKPPLGGESASGWESDSSDDVSEEVKEHKKQFSDWRKKHYNEFHAVKRAKELMQKEEDFMELDRQVAEDDSMDEDLN